MRTWESCGPASALLPERTGDLYSCDPAYTAHMTRRTPERRNTGHKTGWQEPWFPAKCHLLLGHTHRPMGDCKHRSITCTGFVHTEHGLAPCCAWSSQGRQSHREAKGSRAPDEVHSWTLATLGFFFSTLSHSFKPQH